MKKAAYLAVCAALFTALAAQAKADDSAKADGLVTIDGHMKGPVLTDNVWGNYMVKGVKGEGSYGAGTYFTSHAFIMYVSKDISDTVSVHADPEFGQAGAGATPKLGTALGQGLKTTNGGVTVDFREITVNLGLPDYGVQLRAGYMNLPLTMDYGRELFWHEEFNGGKFTLGSAWHDTGLEIYKPFEIKDFTLPTYLYIVNGNGSANRDNNNSRAVMLHVEPQVGPVKLFASYGCGKWGDTGNTTSAGTTVNASTQTDSAHVFSRWSAGAEYAYKAFKVRAETAGSNYQKNLSLNKGADFVDTNTFGYYGKLFYTIVPEKLTAMLHYNYYWDNVLNGAGTGILKEKYDTTYVGLQYELAPAATFLAGYTYGNWRNDGAGTDKDYVRFNRIETSVRVTF